jgi:hypothetical protein
MHREGAYIYLDPKEQAVCPGLGEALLVEEAPRVFEWLSSVQILILGQRDEYRDSAEAMSEREDIRQVKLAAASRKLIELGGLQKALGQVAPEEIGASFSLEEVLPEVPGIDLERLYEE